MTESGLAAHSTSWESYKRTIWSDTSRVVEGTPSNVVLLTEGGFDGDGDGRTNGIASGTDWTIKQTKQFK